MCMCNKSYTVSLQVPLVYSKLQVHVLYVRSMYSTYVRTVCMCVTHPPTHLQGIRKQLVHSFSQGGTRGQQLETRKQKETTRRSITSCGMGKELRQSLPNECTHMSCEQQCHPSRQLLRVVAVLRNIVEPLYRGHHWNPAGCPVYSGTSL